MLPAAVRMRRSEDFAVAVRRGRRAGRATLVVHYLPPPDPDRAPAAGQPLVGFVVGRGVGGSVQRHRVSRQLRHLVRDRLDRLPAGSRTVVRALPAAWGRTSADLGADLDTALTKLLTRVAS